MKDRLGFWAPVLLLLGVMGAVQVLSIRQETTTWDEPFDLAAGYSYWKTGDFRINIEHPPVGKFINALPLLFLKPRLPLDHPSWAQHDKLTFGQEFLYRNHILADTLLFAGRSMTILLTLCLGLALALWTRRQFGPPAAVLSLFLFAFDPNLIAHGRYVTSDLPVTLFAFLSSIAWAAFLSGGRKRDLALAGLTFGLAMASKVSAVFLLPVDLLLYLIHRWQQRSRLVFGHLALSFAALVAIGFLVIAAAYAPEAGRLLPATRKVRASHPSIQMLQDAVDTRTTVGRTMAWAGRRLGLQAHSFLVMTSEVALHNQEGHAAYLLGKRSEKGWWYYFPVAFAVKTPSAILLGLAVLLLASLYRAFSSPAAILSRLRAAPFAFYVLIIPVLVYFSLCLTSHINIGVRHLLPIYPFLFVLLGTGLWRSHSRYRPAAIALTAALLVAESARIYPHYLAFFNTLAGGPANGPRFLLDSNIDWGQDVKKLAAYLDTHGIPGACTFYFGGADLAYYGIMQQGIPKTHEKKRREELDCVAAISVTPLHDVYVEEGSFQWLRELKPFEKIGYSLYLYDLRKDPRAPPPSDLEGIRAAADGEKPFLGEGSILPHIVSGDGFETEFIVANPTAAPAQLDLRFFDDQGRRLPLHMSVVRGVRRGPFVGLTGTIPPGGARFAAVYPESPQRSGYARVVSMPPNAVSVTTLLHRRSPAGPEFFAAAPPGARLRDRDSLPFTNTAAYTTTLVHVNDATAAQDVLIIARDDRGQPLCRETALLAPGERRAFNLADRLSCTAGRAGQLEFQTTTPEGVAGFGFLVRDSGAFTPLTPSRR